ncbi:MAG: transcriptional regulator/sugar kinase [Anaerocolumna sp.]|jgi:predicted NBD/HSP70 family sugar kinase|nr:transcriptional regulator/sugar kinase [Anaerocolumna sp.]
MLSGNAILMKEINKNLVRDSLKILRKATKQELSLRTGLSVVTIHSLLTEMIQEKEVFEGDMVPSNGGRPSLVYCYNENFGHVMVIYGHQKDNNNLIRMLVVNLVGDTVYREEVFLNKVGLDSFDEMIEHGLRKYPSIELVGFGLPGEEEEGIITLNDYENIIGSVFMKRIKDKFRLQASFVNDINAAINGYYHYKSLGNYDSLVGLYFPRIYNPGAGIVIKGEIFTGKSSFAGEIGALPLGIDWLSLDYLDEEKVTGEIAKLLSIFSTILAPDLFVLYGDFLSTELIEIIKKKTEAILGGLFSVNITISDKFEDDFELGMIKATLEQLENKYFITRKG